MAAPNMWRSAKAGFAGGLVDGRRFGSMKARPLTESSWKRSWYFAYLGQPGKAGHDRKCQRSFDGALVIENVTRAAEHEKVFLSGAPESALETSWVAEAGGAPSSVPWPGFGSSQGGSAQRRKNSTNRSVSAGCWFGEEEASRQLRRKSRSRKSNESWVVVPGVGWQKLSWSILSAPSRRAARQPETGTE